MATAEDEGNEGRAWIDMLAARFSFYVHIIRTHTCIRVFPVRFCRRIVDSGIYGIPAGKPRETELTSSSLTMQHRWVQREFTSSAPRLLFRLLHALLVASRPGSVCRSSAGCDPPTRWSFAGVRFSTLRSLDERNELASTHRHPPARAA